MDYLEWVQLWLIIIIKNVRSFFLFFSLLKINFEFQFLYSLNLKVWHFHWLAHTPLWAYMYFLSRCIHDSPQLLKNGQISRWNKYPLYILNHSQKQMSLCDMFHNTLGNHNKYRSLFDFSYVCGHLSNEYHILYIDIIYIRTYKYCYNQLM